MSYVNSSCTVNVTGKITSNSPRDYENDRSKISITIMNKNSKNEKDTAWVNCYFSTKYIENVRKYLTPGRILNVVGELSFTSFNKNTSSNNININGYSLQLIDSNPDNKDNKDNKNINYQNNKNFILDDDDIPF